jgi:neutral amino acid transport system permease protein
MSNKYYNGVVARGNSPDCGRIRLLTLCPRYLYIAAMFSPDYLVFLTTIAAIYAIFSLGLNLQWGFTGLLNFGHAGFMAIGAYGAILLNLAGVPMLLAVLLGGGLAALLGLLMGISTLRLREDYLAIVTIGFSEIIRLVAKNEEWLTKGDFGIQGLKIPLETFKPNLFTRYGMVAMITAVLGIGAWRVWRYFAARLRSAQGPTLISTGLGAGLIGLVGLSLYGVCVQALLNFKRQPAQTGLMFLALLTLAVVYVGLERLVHSPWGRVLKAIREDEAVPRALGKNIFAYKLQSLMLGGLIAGIGAVLLAWQLSNLYPSQYQTDITFTTWTIVVLGGAGSNPGTILGAFIFWAYSALTRDIGSLPWLSSLQADQVGALRIMLIGLILMGLMIWRPQGILGNKDELSLNR